MPTSGWFVHLPCLRITAASASQSEFVSPEHNKGLPVSLGVLVLDTEVKSRKFHYVR